MYVINQSRAFRTWLKGLRDTAAKARILVRIKRAEMGNFGDTKSLGAGLWEMRIDVGAGYRVYYGQDEALTYLLVCGGDKSTQSADIARAKIVWANVKKESSR
ncbi:type II toxin-antitoxin system RelE/ParE family toxin [Pandoraea fibrosis]|uniref:Type II toxin-antitoxin system RelE/ParE family toxin n=1 Tax=Pandoraea fibrosis TaxID=1891094 RepID=A0ABX6HWE4_9BURK|nr:type II toxin-antitoxin system RelE/ParE family toxin [Pandoraea fibrosis]QHE94423.1 type II toxin-antitoxin system RelE/ParE family toxin [Pandoraea fibrosis]QHF15261.1 type II toxin-antitoxin system RelE/ParE family toxin [Pandoraea fibrosis]